MKEEFIISTYYIIVFKNTHDAMEADKKLEKEEMNYVVMPTPTVITKSCGFCIKINNEEDITKIQNEKIFEYKNIYLKNSEGYCLIE